MVYYLRDMAYMGENANTLWGQSAAEMGYVELAAPYSEHGGPQSLSAQSGPSEGPKTSPATSARDRSIFGAGAWLGRRARARARIRVRVRIRV